MKDPHNPARSRSALLIVGLFLCFGVLATMAVGQDDVVRVDTGLVTIPVTVLDRDGRFITGLQKGNFQIFESGVEQEMAFFDRAEQPVTVLLLLDASGSMNDHLTELARSAAIFISQLKENDQIVIAKYSDEADIKIVLEPTRKKDFRRIIPFQERTGDSFTTTFDAVEKGLKYLERFPGRKAMILFSDGELYGKRATAKSNLRYAEEQEALIYSIRFGQYPTHQPGYVSENLPRPILDVGFIGDRDRSGNSEIISKRDLEILGKSAVLSPKERAELIEKVDAYMNGLADRTGGRSFKVDHVADLASAFRAVAGELGEQYIIGYAPAIEGKDGERRRITVKVNVPNVAVRSRNEVIYKKAKK